MDVSYRDQNVAIGIGRDLFVVIWRRETTLPGVIEARERYIDFSRNRDREIGFVTIVEQDAPMPASVARDALSGFLRQMGEKVLVSAVVYEGTGFMAAAVRSVVTGLTLVARQPYPHRVFKTVDEAAAWMQKAALRQGTEAFLAEDVVRQVSDLRKALQVAA